jgi:hypothetical protein
LILREEMKRSGPMLDDQHITIMPSRVKELGGRVQDSLAVAMVFVPQAKGPGFEP